MKQNRLYLTLVLILLFSLPFYAQDAQKAYQNANILYKDGQYNRAIEYYNKAIQLDSNLSYAYLNRAKTYIQLQKWEAAVIDLDKVLTDEPNNKDALLARGEAKFALKLFEGSILDYDAIIKLDDRHIAAYYHKGKSLLEVKRYEEALSAFETVIQLQNANLEKEDNYFKDVYFQIGHCYRLLQEYEQALKHYNLALQIDANNADIYFYRASVKYAKEEWEPAILDYSKAIQLQEDHLSAFYYRAMSYQYMHQYKEAINDFNTVIKKDPELSLAYISRGFTFANMGKYKDAIKDYDWVLEKNPKDAATYIRRGYVFMESGEYDKAIKDFNSALESNPFYKPYALNNRGNCKRLKQDLDGALTDINESLDIDSTNAWAYLNRALVYADQNKPLKALREMEIALQYNAKLPDIYFHRAALYYKQKNYDRALSDYSKLEELDPHYKVKEVSKGKKAAKRAFLKGN